MAPSSRKCCNIGWFQREPESQVLDPTNVGNRLADLSSKDDKEYQAGQWTRAINRKFGKLNKKNADILLQLCENDDLHSTLDYLNDEYRKAGLATKLQKLEPTLEMLHSFTGALNNFAQAGPKPIQLLWASTLFVIQMSISHKGVTEKISTMLAELTNAMPRFERYVELFPTPQLRRALRAIYNDFVDFCLWSADFLSRGILSNILRVSFSSIDRKFDAIKSDLKMHKDEFEAEARLANVQATHQWQDNIQNRLTGSQRYTAYNSQTWNVPFPRNRLFCGRKAVMQRIKDSLDRPSSPNQASSQRSVALHGIGGIGKTQIALEYAYQTRTFYSHVFWVKAETEVELAQTYSSISIALGIDGGAKNEQKQLDRARVWLNETKERWLLIFDNVVSIRKIRPYWPQSSTGNIIATSQKSIFDTLTSDQIKIAPLTTEEGTELILRQLHLDDNARQDAEELSNELGGSPLAIAHYAGYGAASQIPLLDILKSFQRRATSAEIWSCHSNASLMYYEKTLDTVWDASLETLNANARELLDIMAFLNPDCVFEDFLLGAPYIFPSQSGISHSFSLTVKVSDLTRRNLIERDFVGGVPSLRMHRSLQLSLLLKMDVDVKKRQAVFEKAISLMRHAFPHRDMTSRTPANEPIWKRSMPQILSLQMAFERSDPPIVGDLEFGSLLADASSFLWEQHLPLLAVPILKLAQSIISKLLDEDGAITILAHLETYMALFEMHESIEGRPIALKRLHHVVELRERFYNTVPPGTATIEQETDLGRAWNDLGYLYADIGNFDEAETWMSKSLELYRRIGSEQTLRFRFALQYTDLAVVRVGQGRIQEGLDLLRRGNELCRAELGNNHMETVRFEAQWSYALLTAGDFKSALEKHMNVLETRMRLLEKDNPETLTSYYWVGTMHYYMKNFEEAEKSLRAAIEYNTRSGFGQSDLARVQYRLALLLHEQGRKTEAESFQQKAMTSLNDKEKPEKTASREELMALFDKRVYIQNGRSTGPFSPRSKQDQK